MPLGAPLGGRVPSQQPEHPTPDEERSGKAGEHALPSNRGGEQGSQEDRGRLADVAHAVDAQDAALLRGRAPARDVAHAHREGRAGEAEEEGGHEKGGEGVGLRNQEDRDRDRQHQDREDLPPSEPVGQDSHGQPGERSEQNGNGHEERGLGGGQIEPLAEADREGADQAPGGEADPEGQGPQREVTTEGGFGRHRFPKHTRKETACRFKSGWRSFRWGEL